MSIKNNTTQLQGLLAKINALPEAGTDLPELTNEGEAADLMLGKQLIDNEGKVVEGSFTIDNEINTQTDLVSQIQAALVGKSLPGEGGGASETDTCTIVVDVKKHPFAVDFGGLTSWGSVLCETYEGEAFVYKEIVIPPQETLLTIPNVKCGSLILFGTDDQYMTSVEVSSASGTGALSYNILSGVEMSRFLYGGTFAKAPVVKDEICTVEVDC